MNTEDDVNDLRFLTTRQSGEQRFSRYLHVIEFSGSLDWRCTADATLYWGAPSVLSPLGRWWVCKRRAVPCLPSSAFVGRVVQLLRMHTFLEKVERMVTLCASLEDSLAHSESASPVYLLSKTVILTAAQFGLQWIWSILCQAWLNFWSFLLSLFCRWTAAFHQ